MSALPHVRVGVSVILHNAGGKLLLGKRKGSHGAGTWQFPGGHLDYGEEIVDCAAREVLEETGLAIANPKLVAVANSVFERETKHYVTLFVRAELHDENAEVQVVLRQQMDKSSIPRDIFLTWLSRS
jgi:8-oxo-dGTP diphosphatase